MRSEADFSPLPPNRLSSFYWRPPFVAFKVQMGYQSFLSSAQAASTMAPWNATFTSAMVRTAWL
jgi:hypothetical protein